MGHLVHLVDSRVDLLEADGLFGSGRGDLADKTVDLDDLVGDVLQRAAGIADEIGNAKIAEPLGTSLATADTSKVESQYSWNSLTDFHNNMQSVLNIYTGKLGFNWSTDTVSVSLNGLYAFVAYHDTTLATRVLSEIIAAQQKIALIKGDGIDTTTAITGAAKPFRTQILDANGRLLASEAIAACNTLRATLTDDVLPLLGDTAFA